MGMHPLSDAHRRPRAMVAVAAAITRLQWAPRGGGWSGCIKTAECNDSGHAIYNEIPQRFDRIYNLCQLNKLRAASGSFDLARRSGDIVLERTDRTHSTTFQSLRGGNDKNKSRTDIGCSTARIRTRVFPIATEPMSEIT